VGRQVRIRQWVVAVVGSLLTVLIGITFASIFRLDHWIGIMIVVFAFGVVMGSIGVSRNRR
jgi:hypothetical protein